MKASSYDLTFSIHFSVVCDLIFIASVKHRQQRILCMEKNQIVTRHFRETVIRFIAFILTGSHNFDFL